MNRTPFYIVQKMSGYKIVFSEKITIFDTE